MHTKEYLIFNLDDTLVKTQPYINKVITQYFYHNDKIDLLFAMRKHLRTEGGLTLDDEIRKYIMSEVINKKEFMLKASPSRLFKHFFSTTEHIAPGQKIVICTHRGWDEQGLEHSEAWLENQDPAVNIEKIHCISSKEHPNKIEYLSEFYDDFYLIDDNPFGDLTKLHKPDPNVLIYDELGKYPAHAEQSRILYHKGVYFN